MQGSRAHLALYKVRYCRTKLFITIVWTLDVSALSILPVYCSTLYTWLTKTTSGLFNLLKVACMP